METLQGRIAKIRAKQALKPSVYVLISNSRKQIRYKHKKLYKIPKFVTSISLTSTIIISLHKPKPIYASFKTIDVGWSIRSLHNTQATCIHVNYAWLVDLYSKNKWTGINSSSGRFLRETEQKTPVLKFYSQSIHVYHFSTGFWNYQLEKPEESF